MTVTVGDGIIAEPLSTCGGSRRSRIADDDSDQQCDATSVRRGRRRSVRCVGANGLIRRPGDDLVTLASARRRLVELHQATHVAVDGEVLGDMLASGTT